MEDLTDFQRDVLYVIGGSNQPKGLDIKDELEDYYEREVNHGRLYPNLDSLVDRGVVKKAKRDGRTNAYELTDDGYQAIEARREWEAEYIPFAD